MIDVKSHKLLLALMSSSILFGCKVQQETAGEETSLIRPAKVITVETVNPNSVRRFSAVVGAEQSTELAFRVNGQVEFLDVVEGQRIKKGELIASLDDTDFEILLDDASAKYDLAFAQYKRIQLLTDKGLASKSESDTLLAEMLVAKANLEQANQNLKYTELRAPFDGIIAQNHVEQHDHIAVAQPIFSFQNESLQEVSFDLPEKLVERFNPQELVNFNAKVVLDAYPNTEIDAQFKEMQKHSSHGALSYRVTFSMLSPDSLRILPGMSADLSLSLAQNARQTELVKVPLAAVFSDEKVALDESKSFVWLVNDNNQAAQREVVLSRIEQDGAVIAGGLKVGERIIAAAPTRLSEGQEIKPMARERGL
ncbi:RND efflux system membrane fusion protein [Shewanella sediminis HAW-EB3]|uniref:RND efflux system membrane fusion protein n=1 Tax=Shewanella sediminis (strain HAW-EB3) TaxID=425104 RepID=A8G0H3_SHESH|nr:efflux RND transporter periplasmic adaptor subunit [Shewanella sediminis]ABV38596.1 RND efflux system membrane fusion protein [Shewanella sediminis HAW-EB3]